MSIGYAASSGEKNIWDTLKFTKDHGFDGVELNVNMPIFFPEYFTKEEREKIKKYKEELDIQISLHGPEDLTLLQLQEKIRTITIDRFKEVIDFGEDIGATRVTFHIGSSVCFTLTDRKSYLDEDFSEEYEKVLRKSLIELCEYAKGRILLCIENSGRFPKNMVQHVLDDLMKEYELYLTWDIGHSYTNQYDEINFFLNHIDRIRTCHLHDHNGKSDHQIIGEGKVDFLWHLEKMNNQDILYIIEVRPRENAVLSRQNLQNLKK